MQITAADAPKTAEPPYPSDSRDVARWRHTRLRRRMLEGTWDQDLRDLVIAAAGTKRAEAWKMVDLSANVFRSSMAQVAVQYDRTPFVLHSDPAGQEVAKAVAKAGYWRLMPLIQRDTLGCRENGVRVDVIDGRLVYRPAPSDRLVGESMPSAPDRFAVVSEVIERKRGTDCIWTWEHWDVSDRRHPRVHVVDADGKDVSREFLRRADGSPAPIDGLYGDDFTWRGPDGRPFAPYVLHHARSTGRLWDPYEARELVAGSLNIALMWSFWGHIVRNCAWQQRYGINVRPVGAELRGEDADVRQVVETDPATIQLFEADSDDIGRQVTLGTLAQSADPMVVAEAIALFERRVCGFAGISPSDVQRVAGDPRSGFALAISREGQREAQQRFEPQFRAGDEELLAMSAILLWRAHGVPLPVDDYEIRYQTLPLNADERESQRRDTLELLTAGLISKVEAYQRMHPALSDADAVEHLERIARTNQTVGATRTAQGSQAEGLTLAALVEKVTSRAIPRDSGVAIIVRSFGVDEAAAELLVGSAGETPSATAATPADTDTDTDADIVDTAAVEKVADTALNGAQMAEGKGIVADAAAGLFSRESALAMLRTFLQLSEAQATALLGPEGFKPASPATAPTPPAPAPTPNEGAAFG